MLHGRHLSVLLRPVPRAARLPPLPATPQETEADAAVVVELLAAELRLYRTQAEQAAGQN